MRSTGPGTDEPRLHLTPEWLSWLAAIGWRILATAAFALVLGWLAIQLSTTTASVLIAGIVSATFAPFVLSLRQRGWGRAKAAGVVTLGAVLVVTAIVVVIALAFAPHVEAMISGLQAGVTRLSELMADVAFPPEVAAVIARVAEDARAWLTGEVTAIAGLAATVVTISILAGLLTFYLLQDGDKAFAWAIPAELGWRRQPVRDAAVDAMQRVGGYLRGSAVLGAIYGVTDFVVLWLLGVPFAAPLSVLVFLANFVPYVGGITASIVLVLVTLGAVGTQAAIMLILFIGVRNLLVSNVVRPIVYGRTVDLHPAVVLMVLPAGAAVAGVFGLFVAIPVTAFVVSVAGAIASVLDTESPNTRQAHEDPGGDPEIPVWVDRLGQWSARLLVAAGLGALILLVAGSVPLVVVTATIGIILAATFRPASQRLERRGWPAGRAAFAITAGGMSVVTVLVVASIAILAANAPALIDTSGGGATDISDAELIKTLVSQVGVSFITTITSVIAGIVGFAFTLLLGALLTFYLLRDGSRGWAVVIRRFSGWRRETIDQAGQRAVSILGNYMIGTGALAAFGAITGAIIMFILGLPLILPIAMLSFILGFIPYIGGFLGTILAFLVAVKVGTTQDIIVMAVWTIVFNIVQGSFVAPIVYGKAVSLHPAIVLIAIPAGGQLAGVIGMFLGVPILGIVAAVWRSLLAVMSDQETAQVIQTTGLRSPPDAVVGDPVDMPTPSDDPATEAGSP